MNETKLEQDNEKSLIDPIYENFVRGVTRAIGSSEFYEFFMDAISKAENEFQFSNRKMIKTVDLDWVDEIETALNAMQNIISSPRNVIKEEDLIVNIANARKTGSEVVRHLAMHSSLIEQFDEEAATVRPSKVMQRFREETTGIYENRLVFTTLEYAYHFVKIRYEALLEAMSDEFGAKLKVKSDMDSATEHVHMDMYLHIKKIDSPLTTDSKNAEVFNRISRIYRVLSMYMNTDFAQQLSKTNRVKGTINRTNVLKKNKNYREVVKLFEFLRSYNEVGYSIKIVEQNPTINDTFKNDIYRNILFNYLILKGYLEDESDRTIPTKAKGRKRSLKPKFIREILEELTEDYDLPDVEIRKVLIEELTKKDLMKEESAERRRLVEERKQRVQEEKQRIREEKLAEKERIKKEKEEEKERIQREKEALQAKLHQEKLEIDIHDRTYKKILMKEIRYFEENIVYVLQDREKQKEEINDNLSDYADAAKVLEELEKRKEEEKALKKQMRIEAKKQAILQKKKEEEEQRRVLEEKERQAFLEKQRLENKKFEEERQNDLKKLKDIISEVKYFEDTYMDSIKRRKNI